MEEAEGEGGVEAVTLLPVMALGPCSSFDLLCCETESTRSCASVCLRMYVCILCMYVCMYACRF